MNTDATVIKYTTQLAIPAGVAGQARIHLSRDRVKWKAAKWANRKAELAEEMGLTVSLNIEITQPSTVPRIVSQATATVHFENDTDCALFKLRHEYA